MALPRKVVQIAPLVLETNITLCKTAVQQIAEFFLYLPKELKLTVSAIKGYRSAVNHVYTLGGTDLASNRIISRMFSSIEKSREFTIAVHRGDSGMYVTELQITLDEPLSLKWQWLTVDILLKITRKGLDCQNLS